MDYSVYIHYERTQTQTMSHNAPVAPQYSQRVSQGLHTNPYIWNGSYVTGTWPPRENNIQGEGIEVLEDLEPAEPQ